ncbi:ABC transporter permease [Paenibacillus piscarius]|uniref:ABC transporter permease n=1 Tax=Paenibacillus piscarius TaxID=1089681 RepID=UPI001EE89EDD|nr:ABC transporter permease [Paenibacillus piscarius]
MRALQAELSKLFSLPGIWLAFLIGILGPAAFAALDCIAEKEDILAGISTRLPEVGFIGLGFGVQGVILLGVLAVSSEYVTESSEAGHGQQITTSLTAVSSRLQVLLAKAAAVSVVSILLCSLAIAAIVPVTRLILGEYAPAMEWTRLAGATLYWMFTALIAFSFTVLTKNGMIPLTLLMINSSLVSFSVLLAKVTTLAYYLPDRAGIDMFMSMSDAYHTPLAGGLVMLAWVAVLLAIAAIVFQRRDVGA